MTSIAELRSSLEMHKRLLHAPHTHIRASGGKMRIVSASSSGMTLITRVASDSVFDNICVDVSALSAFTRGSKNVKLSVTDNVLLINSLNIKGKLPGINEDYPRIPKSDDRLIPKSDALWLQQIIPHTALTTLGKDGSFSMECSDGEWRLACTDSIHGICAFGAGAALSRKLQFSLSPDDALVLKSLLELGVDDEIRLSLLESAIIVFVKNSIGLIPTIDGSSVQTKENIIKDTKKIAKIDAVQLKDAMTCIEPFASVKDAPPISFDLRDERLVLKASSSVGSIEQVIPAVVLFPIHTRLAFNLADNLITKLRDNVPVVIRSLTENQEITRLSFVSGSVHYLMLTSST
jgi:hypothetical protein